MLGIVGACLASLRAWKLGRLYISTTDSWPNAMQDSLSSNRLSIGRRYVPKAAELSISLPKVCNLSDVSVDYCFLCSPSVSIRKGNMATDFDGLCSVCTNIDLKEYFRREIHVERTDTGFSGPNHDALRLGYLEDIGKRSESCSFCRLIIECLRKR